MKRYLGLILMIGALGTTMASQATRQSPGRLVTAPAANNPVAQIDDAGAQLRLLEASQGRTMDTVRKMTATQNALNDKIAAVCQLKARVAPAEATKAVAELCDTAAQSSQQMLALQMQMQNESRQFQTISNVMKARHDAAKNSISNVR